MHDLASFRARYPEFNQVLDPTVNACLAEAEEDTDETVFLAKTDQAHGALTAHLLQSNPRGRDTRLKADAKQSAESVYLTERRRLETLCCAGRGAL